MLMNDSRITKAKLNIIFSLFSQVITLVCGLIIPGLLIRYFGSEAYGATTSIAQFLSYITLIEGGIGGVARAALYNPLADNDIKTISCVIDEIKRFFNVIGYIFILYVLILACSFKYISNAEGLDWIFTFWLVIVISVSTFAEYFIGISYSILLQASQKTYITKIISMITTVLNTIFIIVLVYCGCNLIIVKLISSIVFALRPIFMKIYVEKKYTLINSKEGKTKYLSQKWTALGQHIAYFLHSYTDVAVLTIFTDLKLVAVYSVYSMIVTQIQNLTVSFATGMEALFGDMLAKKEYKLLHKTFGYYETLISFIAVTAFAVTTSLILPFVKLYTKGVDDVNYIYPLFAVLLPLASLLYCLRQPYHAMIMAAAHFKQTQIGAYGEAAINILLSIVLVHRFSLVGVAIGTVCAVMFRFIYYVIYLSQNIFNRPLKLFLKRGIVNGGAFLIIFLIGHLISELLIIESYVKWLFVGCVVFVFAVIIMIIVMMLFYKDDFNQIINKLPFYKRDSI